MLRGIALALLPLLALLALLEGLLWALGTGDPDDRRALTRGFDERASYLVPDPDVPGGWVTQMFSADDGLSPEVHIPPKGGRLRVLMFGGSNTEGFPTEYVAKVLNQRLPDPGVEVFNLGRHGYGSERVRILVSQAMAVQPDVVFLYMGHNEFVERGFAMELAHQWAQPWQARVADQLLHLRTLNVLVSALENAAAPPPGAGRRPESRGERGQEFNELSFEQTLVFFEVYRRNYEAILRATESAGAQTLIATVIANDFDPPSKMNFPPTMPQALVDATAAARGQALGRIPERFLPGLIQTRGDNPPIHLRPTDWGEAVPEEVRAERRARGAPPVPPTLRPLARPLDRGPYWSEPTLWTAPVPVLLDTIAAVHARKLTADERQALRQAVTLFEKARELVPDHAFTLFEQGLCLYLLGDDPPRAARLLREAAHFDRAPMRGNDISNGIVRELAADHPAVAFVDTEAFMRGLCPDGLISYEVMMDNCHMHTDVLPYVMDTFLAPLEELCRRALAARAR